MPKKPFVRSPYNYDGDVVSEETGLYNDEESMTDQQFAEEVDINTIASRFGLFGELPQDLKAPTYGDFTVVTDYHSAMNAVAQANEAFAELPAGVRARFHNDPQELLEFVSKEENRDEARKMGMLVPQMENLTQNEVKPVTEKVPEVAKPE